jgi:hypothetical protein
MMAGMDDVLRSRQEFDQAELRADVDRVAQLLADDFLSIGERGFVLDKGQWVARHADFTYLSTESFDLDVRRYDGCAIIRDIHQSRATWQGQLMALKTRRSQVWVVQSGAWRLAAIQFSTLAED